jgi:hypothetical protein
VWIDRFVSLKSSWTICEEKLWGQRMTDSVWYVEAVSSALLQVDPNKNNWFDPPGACGDQRTHPLPFVHTSFNRSKQDGTRKVILKRQMLQFVFTVSASIWREIFDSGTILICVHKPI